MPTEATSSMEEEGVMCGSAGWLILSKKSVQACEHIHNLKIIQNKILKNEWLNHPNLGILGSS